MSFTFFRWVRFGVAAALDGTILEAGGGPRAHITVGVDVKAADANRQLTGRAGLAIDVLGPGDVAAVDHRQVVRTFPVAGTLDFETTYFAHIELDRPDLPWLFTPAPPATDGSLRPWMCLVVVEKREGVNVVQGTPMPKLLLPAASLAELPPLADAHRWAHVQVTGAVTTGLDVIARTQPERILSRVVCPRALEADKSYYACLVPTYKVGVDAGLGREVAATAALDEAWGPGAGPSELPVYYHWEFATGGSGDFKSLVTRLQARADLPGVGTRPLDVTTPGFGLQPRGATVTVPMGGALRVTPALSAPIDTTLAPQLVDALGKDGMTPPIYGRWHAGSTVTATGRPPRTAGWLTGLNLDPRHRVAAGLGTKVVQDRQEDLMAAVWEQFGEILKANQILRNAQLAVTASERVVARHLTPLPPAELLAVAGPAFRRIRLGKGRTVRRTVVESCAPIVAFSGAFRRIVRTRGPFARRLTQSKDRDLHDVIPPPATSPASLIAGLAAGNWKMARATQPGGAIPAPVSIGGTRPRPRRPDGEPGAPLAELLPVFARLADADRAAQNPCAPLDLGSLASDVGAAITPDVAIAARVRAQLSIPSDPRLYVSDRLDPVMAAPEIPTPMIGPLIELGQDWLLPGLVSVPPNVVTLVEPDAAFIEAYMVGLNHEMGRELLWRGFPTDQRGTVFSKFWDRRASVGSSTAPIPERDIPPIAGWSTRRALGNNMDGTAGAGVILLIRGDLLQRYPRATIFLQRARWKRDPRGLIIRDGQFAVREPVPLPDDAAWDAHALFPTLTGRTGADVTYLGFQTQRGAVHGRDRTNLPGNAADDTAGWYVVFQEQPTEPRFGFPASAAPPALPAATTHSDAIAAYLLRQAFRLFVHGSDLVTP